MLNNMSRRDMLLTLAGMGISAALPGCVFPSPMVTASTKTSLTPLTLTRGRRPPNILLVVTDQEFNQVPQPAGYTLPAHDWLRSRGVTFDNYLTTTAPCTPARATLFTGQHVPLTKMFDNINFPYVGNMSDKFQTIGSMLRRAGYYTAYKGKWHLSRSAGSELKDSNKSLVNALEPFGFSDFNPRGDFHGNHWTGFLHDPEIAESANQWLMTRAAPIAASQPWFLMVGFVNPHDVMFADNNLKGEKIQTNVGPFDIKPPPEVANYQKQWDVQLAKSFKASLATKPQAQQDYQQLTNVFFGDMPLDREDMFQANANYYLNCLKDVDSHILSVLEALEKSGQADNTIIVFTADHGEMLGAHGLRQKGPLMYKENLNVPLIVVHPDLKSKAGTTTKAIVSSIDMAPTMLALAGLSPDVRHAEFPQLKGIDFSGSVQNPEGKGLRSERSGGLLMTYDSLNSVDTDFMVGLSKVIEGGLSELELTIPPRLRPNFEKRGFMRAVFDGKHKFARYFAPVRYNRPKTIEELVKENDLELYDTHADPDEIQNLATDVAANRDLIVAMNYKLEALISAEIGDDSTMDLPELPKLRPLKFQR